MFVSVLDKARNDLHFGEPDRDRIQVAKGRYSVAPATRNCTRNEVRPAGHVLPSIRPKPVEALNVWAEAIGLGDSP